MFQTYLVPSLLHHHHHLHQTHFEFAILVILDDMFHQALERAETVSTEMMCKAVHRLATSLWGTMRSAEHLLKKMRIKFSHYYLFHSTNDMVVAGWSAFWTGSHLFHSRHMVEIISYCIMNWKVFNKYQSGTCKKSYIPILCAFTSISSTEQCQQMWWKWEKLLSQKCRGYSYKNNTNIECPSTFHQTL